MFPAERREHAIKIDRNVGGRSHRGWGRGVGSKMANGELHYAWQRTAQSSGAAGEIESGVEDVDLGSVFENL